MAPFHQTYSTLMFSPERGTPLFNPSPTPPEHHVQIGDVGYIRAGRFHWLFNIHLPADHADQQHVIPLPRSFVPLERASYHTSTDILSEGLYYSNTNVSSRGGGLRVNNPFGGPQSVGAGFNLTCRRGRQAAALVLPHGAFSKQADNIKAYKRYLNCHYSEWLDLWDREDLEANGGDELVLITGHHSTKLWAVAVCDEGREYDVNLSLSVASIVEGNLSLTWSSVPSRGAEAKWGPRPDMRARVEGVVERVESASEISVEGVSAESGALSTPTPTAITPIETTEVNTTLPSSATSATMATPFRFAYFHLSRSVSSIPKPRASPLLAYAIFVTVISVLLGMNTFFIIPVKTVLFTVALGIIVVVFTVVVTTTSFATGKGPSPGSTHAFEATGAKMMEQALGTVQQYPRPTFEISDSGTGYDDPPSHSSHHTNPSVSPSAAVNIDVSSLEQQQHSECVFVQSIRAKRDQKIKAVGKKIAVKTKRLIPRSTIGRAPQAASVADDGSNSGHGHEGAADGGQSSRASHSENDVLYFNDVSSSSAEEHATSGTYDVDEFTGHLGPINAVTFSPDGSLFLSGSSDRTLALWYSDTATVAAGPWLAHDSAVNSVTFSSDGRRIASGSDDTRIHIWDIDFAPTTVFTPPKIVLQGHDGPVNAVVFSPDGRYLISGSSDHCVRIWDLHTSRSSSTLFRSLEGHTSRINCVAVDPDGHKVASASSDSTIIIWNSDSATQALRPLRVARQTGPVYCISFAPDGAQIAAGSYDGGAITVWDVETGDMMKQIGSCPKRVNSIAFTPDGTAVVSGSSDGTIRVWSVLGEPSQTLDTATSRSGAILSVSVSHTGLVVSGSYDGTMSIHNIRTGKVEHVTSGFSEQEIEVDEGSDVSNVSKDTVMSPLQCVQQYILKYSDVDLAVVTENDLSFLCLEPHFISPILRTSYVLNVVRPNITVEHMDTTGPIRIIGTLSDLQSHRPWMFISECLQLIESIQVAFITVFLHRQYDSAVASLLSVTGRVEHLAKHAHLTQSRRVTESVRRQLLSVLQFTGHLLTQISPGHEHPMHLMEADDNNSSSGGLSEAVQSMKSALTHVQTSPASSNQTQRFTQGEDKSFLPELKRDLDCINNKLDKACDSISDQARARTVYHLIEDLASGFTLPAGCWGTVDRDGLKHMLCVLLVLITDLITVPNYADDDRVRFNNMEVMVEDLNAEATTHGEDLPSYAQTIQNRQQQTLAISEESLVKMAKLQEEISAQLHRKDIDHLSHDQLFNTSALHLKRFQMSGELADIEEGIKCLRILLHGLPVRDPERQHCINELGSALRLRFHSYNTEEDLDEAITLLREEVQKTRDQQQNSLGHVPTDSYNGLTAALLERFALRENPTDVDEAIFTQQQAIVYTPDGNGNKPEHFDNLGLSLLSRFQHSGNITDANQAIASQQQAVALTPNGHADKPMYLNNLGNSFSSRFKCLGKITDVDQAIASQRQAVALTPDGHADKPGRLSNLGTSLLCRFERLGHIFDVDEAIASQRQAVALTPDGHADKPGRLSNLGNSFSSRFKCLGKITDVDQAIASQQQAVALTPNGHADKPMYLNNLGNSFSSRFKCLGKITDVDQAIASHQQAVVLTPDGHADKPGRLSNLGTSLLCRFERLRDISDVDQAIASQQQAVALTPDGHADKPMYLNNLGNSFLRRFERLGNIPDVEHATDSYRQSALSQSGPPSVLCKASRAWARSSLLRYGIPSFDAHESVIALVPRILWLGTKVSRRYYDALLIGDAVNEAAAAAIELGMYDIALEWLEQGRSIIWGQILHLRTPMDDLRESGRADLADDLERVSRQLEGMGNVMSVDPQHSDQTKASLEDEAQTHRRLAERYGQLLQEARRIPGFERLLLPKTLSDLRAATREGSIVVINVHRTRCDALILRDATSPVLPVPLPSITYDSVKELHETPIHLHGIRARGNFEDSDSDIEDTRADGRHLGPRPKVPASRPSQMEHILKTLWDSIVSPVLSALGHTDTIPSHSSALPHIIWCATGPLSFLPLHAAGYYDAPEKPKVYQYVVSSYTPTLASLLTSYERFSESSPRMLTVSLPHTPSLGMDGDLPGTVIEVEAIKDCIGGLHMKRLYGKDATIKAVLEGMDEYSWCHFACHGVQDTSNPTGSALLLHDGDLHLKTIIARTFKLADIAFLSACQTATGDEKLPEEALYLAVGMLMAGYRTVYATMWSIKDNAGPVVAKEVYTYLLDESRKEEGKRARALHHAAEVLRNEPGVGERNFLMWLPFIHFGA